MVERRTKTGRATRVTAGLLAALLFTTTAAAAPPTDEARARAAVRAYLEAEREGVAQVALWRLEQLAGHDHVVAVDLFLRLLNGGQPAFFPTVRRLLGGLRDVATLDHVLEHGARDHKPEVVAQVLLALGDGRPAGVDWLAPTEDALDHKDPRVRAAAVRALGRARAAGRVDRILELASDRSSRVRQEVPEALARLVGRRALPILGVMAEDDRWRVRLGVVRGLADVKSRRSVELLVEMLAREEGRLREDLIAALQRMTGRNYGLEIDRWRRFVEASPDDVLTRGDVVALSTEAPVSRVRYYGISTLSRRFVFLTDLSGSMATVEVGRYRDRNQTRLELTQEELTKLVEALDADTYFNLVTFADDVERWARRTLPAIPKNRSKAVDTIERYGAQGSTNIYAALQSVFDMSDEAIDARDTRIDDLDTVFLLSDGVPSAGDVRSTELLLDLIAERNRDARLRIHCIALTSDAPSRDFLNRIARITGGQYVSPLD